MELPRYGQLSRFTAFACNGNPSGGDILQFQRGQFSYTQTQTVEKGHYRPLHRISVSEGLENVSRLHRFGQSLRHSYGIVSFEQTLFAVDIVHPLHEGPQRTQLFADGSFGKRSHIHPHGHDIYMESSLGIFVYRGE